MSKLALAQQSVDSVVYQITDVQVDDTLTITYDLSQTEPGLWYRVIPFYRDRYGEPQYITEYVAGSWGDSITAGVQKKIFWNPLPKLRKGYRGGLKIGLSVSVIAPSPEITLEKSYYRRGKRLVLTLDEDTHYHYHVLDTNRLVYYRGTVDSSGERVKLPMNLPLKQDYQIRIEDETGNVAYTTRFAVRRFIPLGVIVGVPTVATAAALYLLLRKEELPAPHGLSESE
ncbi:MAG: hypothetical protein AAF944_03095 [Bacteroidota bacterium]